MNHHAEPLHTCFEEEYQAYPEKGYGFPLKQFQQRKQKQPTLAIESGTVVAGYHKRFDEFLVFLILGQPSLIITCDPVEDPDAETEHEVYQTQPFSPYHYPSEQYEISLPEMKCYRTINTRHLLPMSGEYIRENLLVIDHLKDLRFVNYAYNLNNRYHAKKPAPSFLLDWTGPLRDSKESRLHRKRLEDKIAAFSHLDES